MTPPKGKQRSIHMDDETFDLLQALALKHKINNSSVVRMALAAFADAGPAAQRPASTIDRVVAKVPATAANIRGDGNARGIVLPDPSVSSFKVVGSEVRERRPRNDREDDGLDV